jgi:pyruvate formate lyase activating enzyme
MSILDRRGKKKSPKEALFWAKEDGKVRCDLCPHKCRISEGKKGICGVRGVRDGKLFTLVYGKMTSMMVDPIEKKPLFHFYPGSDVLSFGTVGCNFKCGHCQNWSISQMKYEDLDLKDVSVQDVVDYARRKGCRGIAWTYNEPSIWYEFTLDGCKEAKKADLYTVYVTNGFIEREPLELIAPYLDAMNIDVKAFNEDFYSRTCKGRLKPVLETVERAHDFGIFIELTYLLIPTKNDDMKEIGAFCEWIAGISKDIPLHLSRFHPDYKMTSIQATPRDTMNRAFGLAKENGLKYVYQGNVVPGGTSENTYCPKCNELLIERWGFGVKKSILKSDRCPSCSESINVRI